MINKYLSIHILILSIVAAFLGISSADARTGRGQIIRKTLDCYQNHPSADSLDYSDVCYLAENEERQKAVSDALDRASLSGQQETVRPVARSDNSVIPESSAIPAQNYTIIAPQPATRTAAKRYEQTEAKTFTKDKNEYESIFRKKDSSTELELGSEMYFYHYNEPTLDVNLDGTYYGMYGTYTYRTQENKPIKSFAEAFSRDSMINMFRLEGRCAFGRVDYDGSGTYDGINDFVFELRGVAGYDLPVSPALMLTPYAGIGYRYLRNGMDEIPAQTIGGVNYYSGYQRESAYVYMPIGLEANRTFDNNWSLGLNLEYDIFWRGDQVSHLEDMEDLNGNNPNFAALENDQDGGYGIRGSIRIMKASESIDFFAEPFVRYWKVDASNITTSCSGDTGTCLAGYEPKNETSEYGLKLGIHFN